MNFKKKQTAAESGTENNPVKKEEKASADKKTVFFKRKNFKYGTVASVISILVIAAIIGVNAILTVIVNKYPLSVDMTSSQNYKLSNETINYVKKLNTSLTIYVLNTASSFENSTTSDYDTSTTAYRESYELLKQYPKYSSKIKLVFVDINKNPTFKSNYSNETLSLNDIIVQSSNTKYKHLTSSDLFQTSSSSSSTDGSSSVTGNTTEEAVDSAFLYLTEKNLPSVVITTGHGETNYSGIQTLMTKNNYNVTTADISLKAIDSSAKILAIIDPQKDFTTGDLQKIDSFLKNNDQYGKSLMVYLDPSEPALPNLESYLSDYWGLKADRGIVYDQTNAYSSYIDVPIAETLDSTVFSKLNTSIYTLLPESRPITLSFTSKGNVTTQSLIQTYDTAALWVPKSSSDTNFAPSSSDKKGAYTAMALGTMTISGGETLKKSYVLLGGSAAFIQDSLLETTTFNNGNAAIAAANYISNYSPSLNIVAKSVSASTLNITSKFVSMFQLIFLFLLPLIMVILGFVVWLRRRHL